MKEENKEVTLTVMETEPLIKKVEMIENGRKGLKVTYSTYEKRNGSSSIIEIVRKQKRPTQRDLRDWFKELRTDLLNICGYDMTNDRTRIILTDSVTVTGVVMTEDKFVQIIGKKVVLGDYTMDLVSPKIDVEEYELKDGLLNIVSNIHRETSLFMRGLKGADKKQVVLDFLTVKKGVEDAEEVWNKMSKGELNDIMEEALKSGGIEFVYENGELVSALVDDEPVVQGEMKFEFDKLDEINQAVILNSEKSFNIKEKNRLAKEEKLAKENSPKEAVVVKDEGVDAGADDMLFLDEETPTF